MVTMHWFYLFSLASARNVLPLQFRWVWCMLEDAIAASWRHCCRMVSLVSSGSTSSFPSPSLPIVSSTSIEFYKKRGVAAFTSIDRIWNSGSNASNKPHLLQPFWIISFLDASDNHAVCSHEQRYGFKVDILKSILGLSPQRTWSLMIDDVQRLNSLANACFSGHCRITSAGWNLLVQFAGIKTKHMHGWLSFTQLKNAALLWTLQQSISHRIFCDVGKVRSAICFSR
jgi:hypothetical protein